MKSIIEAQKIDGTTVPRHLVEVLCPNCGRDVDEQELQALLCNDCGFDLSEPKQNVAIHVTTLPSAGGKIF